MTSRNAGEKRWGDGWTQPLVAPKGVRVKGNHLLDEFDQLAEPLGFDGWWGWQRHFTAMATALDKDGNYKLMDVYIEAMRRMGKTEWLRGRCLLGLKRGERIMIVSQDLEQTVTEIFEPVLWGLDNLGINYIENRRLGHYVAYVADDKKEINRRTTPRLRVSTDKPKGSRGKENDTIIVDEAAHIMQSFLGIAGATGATVRGFQTIQASTAGKEQSERWMTETANAAEDQKAGEPDVGIMVWAGTQEMNWRSTKTWERLIPTFEKPGPAGMSKRFLRRKLRTESPEDFKREYLGITPFRRVKVFGPGEWEALERIKELPTKGVCALGVDAAPDGTMVAIAGVWKSGDEYIGALLSVGTDDALLYKELLAMVRKHRPWITAGDVRSPANHALMQLGSNRRIRKCAAQDASAAATGLRSTVAAGELSIISDDLLDAAALSAETRPIADIGWGFDRSAPDEDNPSPHITPLVALAFALHALKQRANWARKDV